MSVRAKLCHLELLDGDADIPTFLAPVPSVQIQAYVLIIVAIQYHNRSFVLN